MKKSRFTESQIVAILKEGEAGVAVAQITRKHGISAATYYHWKSKYGGAAVSELKRLRELEVENTKLKRMYADLALENTAIKDVLSRNSDAVSQARGDPDHVRRTRRADRASLPGNPAIAGGVLPIGHRSSIARRDSYHGSASYRDRGAALGVLEVSRPTARAGLRLESQAHLARVLPAAPEPATPNQETGPAPRTAAAASRAANERGMGT